MGHRFSSSNKIHVVLYAEYSDYKFISAHTTLIGAQAVHKKAGGREAHHYILTWDGKTWETQADAK